MKISTLCYVKRDGKTLMLFRGKKKNDYHKGKWNGLGGKFEKGETPEECVIREVLEESGLTIANPKLVGRILFPDFGLPPEDWHVYIFTASEFTGELIDSAEGDLSWIPDEEVINLNLWEADKYFFEWMKKGKFFSGKMVYEGEKVVEKSVIFYD